jgi:hypothetical protein
MRAVSGMQLAGEILSSLNTTISTRGAAPKLSIQFGAYATFASFFGLADLPSTSPDFRGIVDYASSMALELFTTADVGAEWPSETENLQVRFLFHNGTAGNASAPTVFPLFGGRSEAVSWNTFAEKVGRFAIRDTRQWCGKCGNDTGVCAAYADKGQGGSVEQQQKKKGGLSPAIGGVIGAFMALAVVLASVAVLMLLGGFTVTRGGKKGKVVEQSVETKA